MSLKLTAKAGLLSGLAMVLAGLGGCGFEDGVQLNGKIFDVMGLNGSSKSAEPKVAARQPLTLPPSDALPPPGSSNADQPSLAEIQDPDRTKQVSQADQERQQAEYCKKNYDPLVARGDDSADTVTGPLGPCHGSVFSAVKKWTTPDDGSSDDSETQ
jgi:hypothetical protein